MYLLFLFFSEYYGFVTFHNTKDTYQAIEHGNDKDAFPQYDLCFGGRRIFCQTTYADLGRSYYSGSESSSLNKINFYLDKVSEAGCGYPTPSHNNSFDALLREAKEKLQHRNS